MSDFMAVVLVSIPLLVALEMRWRMGRKEGVKAGKEEAQRIIMRGMEIRISPTAHNALICIAGNQTMDEMVKELEKVRGTDDVKKKPTTCYLVAHQELKDGVLTTERVGVYSESGQGLTTMGSEINANILECDGKDYSDAKENVMKYLNYMADLGIAQWVHLRDLLLGDRT